MDPCSIFGLVTTCVTIAGGASRLVHQLHSLRTRLQSVDVRMQLLETQVRALKTATANISEWLKDSPEDFGRNEEPAVDLGAVLEACDTLILLLQEHASKALSRVDRLGSIDLQAKIKTLWEEDDIKELQELLRNQVQSLNLMLQCFQLPSRADRRAMLTSADMRESIKKAQDTSSSLRWLMDDESCLTEKTTGTRASNCLDHNVTFDFDAEVMGSRVYRDTFASMIGNDLRGGPKEMPLPSSSGASLNEKTQAHRTSENRMSEKPIPGDRNTFSTILHTEAGRQRALDGLLMTRNTMKATELLQRWISPESHTAVVCENAIWILQTEPQCESVLHLMCALGDSDGIRDLLDSTLGMADSRCLCICLRQLLRARNGPDQGHLNVLRLLLATGAEYDRSCGDMSPLDLVKENFKTMRTDADLTKSNITIRPSLVPAVVTVILFHLFGADFGGCPLPGSAMDIFDPNFWVQKIDTYMHPIRDFMIPSREKRVDSWIRSVLLSTWAFREGQFRHKALQFSSDILQFPGTRTSEEITEKA